MGFGSAGKQNKVVRVPVVLQMESAECGAACLAMVLAYYGKWISPELARAECAVSRYGSRAVNILKAARRFGMEAQAYRLEPEALRSGDSFPCIIHWNSNHFVVLDGFKRNRAYINDPDMGMYSVPMKEFDQAFTGVCLCMKPGQDFRPGGKPKSILSFVKKRLEGNWISVILAATAAAVASLTAIISILSGRIYLDRLLTGVDTDQTEIFLIALAVLYAIQVIAASISSATGWSISGKLAVSGSLAFMRRLLQLPMSFFSRRMAGDILTRQKSNIAVSENLINVLVPLGIDFLMLAVYLKVMIRYSILLTMIGVFAVVSQGVFSGIAFRKRKDIERIRAREQSRLYEYMVYSIHMMETVRSSGSEKSVFERFCGYQSGVRRRTAELIRLSGYRDMIPAVISSVSGVLILGIGVSCCIKGEFTIGMVSVFQGLFAAFLVPAGKLLAVREIIRETGTQMERIEDVMEYPEDERHDACWESGVSCCEKLRGSIEIRDLTFGYTPQEEPVIRDLSLSVRSGSRVALVGASGSGKSTVLKLISGLYRPWSGEILLDEREQSKIAPEVLCASIAAVNQEIILFDDTIRNNIRMWDRTIGDQRIISAARDAQIHEDIMEKAGGYSYHLTGGGRNLSGGQRQRVEIARALAQEPTVIILDEATSSLDALTELEVIRAIGERGITCIIASHRLSAIRDCDEIFVMDHGTIIDHGSHDALMARCGVYRSMIADE